MTLTYTSVYQKNTGLVLSPEELKEIYFFGIPFRDTATGREVSSDSVKFYIQSAQDNVEQFLGIKLNKQYFKETVHFLYDDWVNWGYIRVTYPIQTPLLLTGYLGNQKFVEYPSEWLTIKKSSDETKVTKNMYTVPTTGSITATNVYFGVISRIGFPSREVPFYWNVEYITGFDKNPKNILNLVGKIASMNIFAFLGDIVLGVPGMSSQSIGIDGLSQSISTVNSGQGGVYAGRIKQYMQEVQLESKALREQYNGIPFAVA